MARTQFTIDPEVQRILKGAEITQTSVKITERLKPADYAKVKRVLDAAGGKWDRAAQATLFERDPREVLGLAAETGKVTNVQNLFQTFYTPPEVAKLVVKAASLRDGLTILEPSAGAGALVQAVLDDSTPKSITCVDLDPSMPTVIKAVVKDYPTSRNVKMDFYTSDFLKMVSLGAFFDRVIMNPPFSGSRDIDHVMHARQFLLPGGVLVALMSPSTFMGTSAKQVAFRAMLEQSESKRWTLPEGSFAASGTMIRVELVRIRSSRLA